MTVYYFVEIMELPVADAQRASRLGCDFRHPTGAPRQVSPVIALQQRANCPRGGACRAPSSCSCASRKLGKFFLCCKVLQVLWEGSGVFLFCRLQVLEATAAIDGQKLILLL